MMPVRSGGNGNFLVNIIDNQNSTWQGRVTWVEGQKSIQFRSALELLKIIDGVINKEEEKGGGCHE